MYLVFLSIISLINAESDLTIEGDAAITYTNESRNCKFGILQNEESSFGVHCGKNANLIIDETTEFLNKLGLEHAEINIENELRNNNVRQWNLIHQENLAYPEGWSNNTSTDCNGMKMLGGHCKYGGGETTKEYT
jgi:hypothetical protein